MSELRNKLEDIGIDTDEKEEYKQAKYVWEEAQKELLEELETRFTQDFGGESPYGDIMDILEAYKVGYANKNV